MSGNISSILSSFYEFLFRIYESAGEQQADRPSDGRTDRTIPKCSPNREGRIIKRATMQQHVCKTKLVNLQRQKYTYSAR